MSWQATAWAVKQRTGSPSAKAVLLVLANRHNPDTGLCCPSIARIAEEAEISKRTVYRVLDGLEEIGLIARDRRHGGFESGSQPNEYRFPALDGDGDKLAHSTIDKGGESATESATESANGGSTYEPKEEITERKKEEEVTQAFAMFNATAEHLGLPQAVRLTKGRRTHLKLRISEYGFDKFSAALARIGRSQFLLGKNDRGWKADIDFLCRPDSIAKILEGKYDTPGSNSENEKSAYYRSIVARYGAAS